MSSLPEFIVPLRNLMTIILVVAYVFLTTNANASAQEPDPSQEPTSSTEEAVVAPVLQRADFRLDGRLDLNYRYRSQERKSDASRDGYASLYVDGVATNESGKENLRFHIDGYATVDFDGLESSADSFYNLDDTRNNRFRPFLYSAWLESETLLPGAKIRIGRQEVNREDALYFDGARADFGNGSWRALAYAGTPVRFYESNRSGDVLGGLGLRWRMKRNLRLGLDQIYLRDQAPPADPTITLNDHLTILSGRWLHSRYATITGSSSWVSGRARRTQLRAILQRPEQRLWSRIEIRRQNDYGDVVSTDLSPFAATLGDVQPYWNAAVEMGKGLSADVDFSLGFQGRWLEVGAVEGLYNRQYQRWYGNLTRRNLFSTNWRAGVRADIWASSGPSVIATGAFARYETQPGQVFEVGTDYSKYRYDAFTGREYLDDRQVYARLTYPILEDTSMRIRLARDGSQFGVDYLVEVSLGWEF